VAIRGIERMSLAEVEHALREGACFVFYEYCISLVVVTLRRPSDIYLLPPPRGGGLAWIITHLLMLIWALVSWFMYLIFPFPLTLMSTAIPTLWMISLAITWGYKAFNDDHWQDETGMKRGLVFSVISLLFGWWGLPWGVIYTPMTMFTNLSGGCDVTDEVWALLQSSSSQ